MKVWQAIVIGAVRFVIQSIVFIACIIFSVKMLQWMGVL